MKAWFYRSLAVALLLQSLTVSLAAQGRTDERVEHIGTISTRTGTLIIGARTLRANYPSVVLRFERASTDPFNEPLAHFPTLDVKPWLVRMRDSLTALERKPHRGGARAFNGDIVLDPISGWAFGALVHWTEEGGQRLAIAAVNEKVDDIVSVWMSTEEMRQFLRYAARAADRSVEMTPGFQARYQYSPIIP